VPERRHPRTLLGPWAYRLNRSGAPLVPIDLACTLAKPWGDLAYAVWGRKAATARRNYAHILGCDADAAVAARLARRCFRHFAQYIAEMIGVQGWDTATILDRLEIDGDQQFEVAEAIGKGIIFVSAHMGSAEIAASIAVLRGYRIVSVVEGGYPAFLMDWMEACRRRMGVRLLPARGSGIRLLRTLQRRGVVALVLDAGIDGVTVEFFGRPTVFPAGPARLARLSGAPLVFGVAARRPGGRFLAHISPPIFSSRELDAEEDALQITRQLASIFERQVRRYPDQWYVFRDIWRDCR